MRKKSLQILISEVLTSARTKAERVQQYFNTLAFAQPAPFSFGNAPRTLPNLRVPNYFTTNLSLLRDFKLAEKAQLQLRAEAFNVFNRANFTTPGTVFGAANFGVITGTEDPRQSQLALRLNC
jgi:hypothetical protein